MVELLRSRIWMLGLLLVAIAPAWALDVEDQIAIYESYTLEKARNLKGAARLVAQVYKKKPQSYFLNMRLAWLFYSLGKHKNAIKHYQNAAEIVKESVEPQLGLMNIHLVLKEYGQVVEMGREIRKRDANNYYGTQKMISAMIQLKQYVEALPILDHMLVFYPNDIVFLEQKGWIFHKLGRTRKANEVMTQVLMLSPTNESARQVLGK